MTEEAKQASPVVNNGSAMTEEAKMVAAVIAAVCAILGFIVFGIVLEPIAIITGIIAATSKKVGIKATGIAAALIAFIMLAYLITVLVAAQSALNSLRF